MDNKENQREKIHKGNWIIYYWFYRNCIFEINGNKNNYCIYPNAGNPLNKNKAGVIPQPLYLFLLFQNEIMHHD